MGRREDASQVMHDAFGRLAVLGQDMPFANQVADVLQQPVPGEGGKDRQLGPFAIELEEIANADLIVAPKLADGR